MFQIINQILSISVNQKDGFVAISANMPESEYAAYAAINARNILQKIIINNKIKSAKQKHNQVILLTGGHSEILTTELDNNDIEIKIPSESIIATETEVVVEESVVSTSDDDGSSNFGGVNKM